MTDEKEIIVEMLREILGNEKLHYENHGQISFNCPLCDDGRSKGNLEVNYLQHVYKCWSCSESNDTHGPLGKLIDLYGNKKHKKLYKIFQPEDSKPKEKPKVKLRLPESFTLFKDSNPRYPVRQQAYNYLKSRGITDDLIDKYRIGFCDKGSHIGRIVVPSYNKDGELTYYIARSWDTKSKSKYKNPQAEKDKIIFNEDIIDWDEDIYLVEGVFDGFFLPNSIPMLGKHMSELLFNTLYEKVKKNIIIALDGDAFDNAVKLYRELNGGKLYGKIKIIHLPKDKDVCDLKGQIDEYYIQIKD
jgi:DNA primase